MLRLSRMTDHSILLLGRLASRAVSEPCNTRDLADTAGLPLTTVAKILKLLQDAGLLLSQRGMHGGYRLARSPENITLCQIVEAMEGPIAMSHDNACIT